MYTAKVEVALRRDIGDVGWDTLFVTELVYYSPGGWIVYGCHDHADVRVIQVRFEEFPVVPYYCTSIYPMADFGIQAITG